VPAQGWCGNAIGSLGTDSVATYTDLSSGTVYRVRNYTGADKGTTTTLALNAAAVTHLNAHLGARLHLLERYSHRVQSRCSTTGRCRQRWLECYWCWVAWRWATASLKRPRQRQAATGIAVAASVGLAARNDVTSSASLALAAWRCRSFTCPKPRICSGMLANSTAMA